MHALGLASGRYDVSAQNTPTRSSVSEAEMAELEEFLANVKLLTSTLGHKIFEEIRETVNQSNKQENLFYCKNSSGVLAKGSPSTEGFIVYKNSRFVAAPQPSLSESVCKERLKMIGDGLLVANGDSLVLKKDYSFSSSSRAASMVLGRSASGPLEWKTEQGVRLREIEALSIHEFAALTMAGD